jgi:hypothetical protein
MRLLRGPLKRPTVPSITVTGVLAEHNHLRSSKNDLGHIVDSHPPLAITSETHSGKSMSLVPISHTSSSSEMSVCSITPTSPLSSTRSSPALTIQRVAAEHCVVFGGDVVIPDFNTAAFALAFKKGLVFEVISPLERIPAESCPVGFAISMGERNSSRCRNLDAPTSNIKRELTLTDIHGIPPVLTPDAFIVDSVGRISPGTFQSDDRSMCGQPSEEFFREPLTGDLKIAGNIG